MTRYVTSPTQTHLSCHQDRKVDGNNDLLATGIKTYNNDRKY